MKKEWEYRLNFLKKHIEYWSKEENKTEKIVKVIHLFYNEYS